MASSGEHALFADLCAPDEVHNPFEILNSSGSIISPYSQSNGQNATTILGTGHLTRDFDKSSVEYEDRWKSAATAEALKAREECSRQRPANFRELWGRAIRAVSMTVEVARQFRTLRDMVQFSEIQREQLKVTRVLGQGAFAVVEECIFTPETATGPGQPRLVAVKRLKADIMKNSVDIKAMMKEISLLKKLKNRHIVEFIGHGSWDNSSSLQQMASLFLVEELIDGGNLKNLVNRQMKVPSGTATLYLLKDAVRWLVQVASGLKYLHQCNPKVIHRDLKLENILLRGRNLATATACIADFGLSALVTMSDLKHIPREPIPRHRHRHGRKTSVDMEEVWTDAAKNKTNALTATLQQKLTVASQYDQLSGRTGTLMYMAPEVYRQEKYNEKADVYSFAIICYELLHRYMMISATDGSFEECQAYARRVARGGYRPPIEESLPSPIKHFLKACWHQSAEQRPGMDKVLDMLLEIQRNVDLDALDRQQQASSPREDQGGCCIIS